MRDYLRTAPISWWAVAGGGILCVVATARLLALAEAEANVSLLNATLDVVFALTWTVCGLFAWRLRPASAIGRLMTLVGVVLFLDAPLGWKLPAAEPRVLLVTTIGVVGYWFQWTLAGQILLTYPSGRPTDSQERRFLVAAHVSAACVALVQLFLESPDAARCSSPCQVSPISIGDYRDAYLVWRQFALWWFAALVVWFVILLVRRARAGGSRWRRQRIVVAVASIAVTAVVALAYAIGAPGGRPRELSWLLYVAIGLCTVLVPSAFLVGLLRDRIGYASVADLVRGLDRIEPRRLEEGLARTLQDRSLRLLFPVGLSGSFVDVEGRPVTVDDADPRCITLLGPGERPVAALLHDPILAESPRLLESAASAAHLSLHNARLQAEVRAQLAETRASRARIVAAADEERQRIERNLHDGAQQRLVGVGMTLDLMRSELEREGAATDYLDEAEAELRNAIQELRELAQGIHPAVLTDEGLVAGIGVLARRMPFAVHVDASPTHRPPVAVETAAYYIVSEALQNVAKHAQASTANVEIRRVGNSLEVCVTDDGVGGASPDGGSGLRGMADRAIALDGTFEVSSTADNGTRVRVSLPCV